MNANLLRRVNWLWKHRHKHDEEVALKSDLVIVRETVETQAVTGLPDGARIHLVLGTAQSVAVNGESVEWTREDTRFPRLEFAAPSFPATEITIPQSSYYGVLLKHFEWDTWAEGGTVQVIRTRAGTATVVEEWSGVSGSVGGGLAAPIPCRTGDSISVFIDHGDSTAKTLAAAEMNVYLIDRETQAVTWELVFALTDNWAVTYDTTRQSFFTSAAAESANPALFERSADGTALNSYAGWDPGEGAAPPVNASLVYGAAFLWGVGQSDDPAIHKINPATGAVVSSISPNVGGTHGWLGIGYNGTNLFAGSSHAADLYVDEYTTAGVFVQQFAYPSGYTLAGITWDGVNWWATTTSGAILRLSTSFAVVSEILGPPVGANYAAVSGGGPYGDCHFRDGFLFVMTRQGLWRRAI